MQKQTLTALANTTLLKRSSEEFNDIMLPMPYTHLLFDADNTLFDFDKAQDYALHHCFSDLGGSFKPYYLNTYNEINTALWHAFEKGDLPQEAIKQKRFVDLVEKLKLELDPIQLSERYVARLAEGDFLLEGALELIEKLVTTHSLSIVTNGLKEVQRPRFSKSPIMKHFDTLIVSDELGIAKPQTGIFEATFKALNQPKKENVLMIGDSLSSDIQGGINYGIDTCWYNPNKKANKLELSVSYEIQALNELFAIA